MHCLQSKNCRIKHATDIFESRRNFYSKIQKTKTFRHLKNCINEKERLRYATNQDILSAENCFNFEKSTQETSPSVCIRVASV